MSRFRNAVKPLVARATAFAARPAGKLAVRVGRGALLVGVLAFLAYQLADVGWRGVWEGLPRTPWFYVLVLAMYFILPITEVLIFGWLWRVPFRRLFGVSLRKRVLNADVLGYSGDVYFGVWAHRRLGVSEREVWRVYKDNTVLSALASLASAAVVVGGLWFGGFIAFADLLRGQNPVHVAVGVALVALLFSAALTFRRALFSLPARTVVTLFGIHIGRFVLGYVLQVAQWWVVLPDTPFEVWGTMLAVVLVMNRLPFLPARDLLSIGAILGMVDLLAASESALAGMLLARSAIDRVLHALLFGGSLLWERRHPLAVEAPPPAPPEEPLEPAASTP
jgi:hypothetical protein